MALSSRQILLLGPPGAGKGTQARRLSLHLQAACLSSGGVLRREQEKGGVLGKRIHAFLEEGRFVPDDLVMEIIFQWLKESEAGFILDGFPRTLAQGHALDRFLADSHRPGATVVYLDVPMALLEQRVAQRVGCDSCGNVWRGAEAPVTCPDCLGPVERRADDEENLFRARFAEYESKTLPLIPYYQRADRLRRVCGQGEPEAIFKRILAALDS